ncbi:MAG: transposase [Acidimicrobiia bacterium]|nr:transposase [Acidimicrobiia bacterium]
MLADLAKGRLRKKIPELQDALAGRFNDHHALMCGAMLARIDHADTTIAALTERIEALLDPHQAAVTLLVTIPGVSQRTAQVILAEIGTDMSRFPHRRASRVVGRHVPRQQRVRRQARLRPHPTRLQMAP